jgi:hypothetical protein
VHELKPLFGSESRLAREEEALLLRQDAGVAELLDVVHVRHASHHPLGAELLQSLKVEMPKALLPPPSFVIATSCKAQGLLHLGIEDVEEVAPPSHLSEKKLLSIPDAHQAILDLHV